MTIRAPDLTVTTLIHRMVRGDAPAGNELMTRAYEELRRIAESMMRKQRRDHKLQATALLNEGLVRLLESDTLKNAQSRAYFYAAASEAMRRVLVDHARKKLAAKRGGGKQQVPLDDVTIAIDGRQKIDVLILDEALSELARMNERQAQVVSLRYFGGLSVAQVAEQLDVSPKTIENDYRIAKAWLRSRLSDRES